MLGKTSEQDSIDDECQNHSLLSDSFELGGTRDCYDHKLLCRRTRLV